MYVEKRPQAGKKSGRKKTIKTLAIIFCVLIVLLIGFGIYVWMNYEKLTGDLGFDPSEITENDFDVDPEAEGLPEVTYSNGNAPSIAKGEGVTDIMLVGVDNRDVTKFTGRSDVLMYLRIDKNNNSLKLVSIMRDTLVPIQGHDYNKINTAFMYGSAELAKDTLSKSLGLSPDYYMVVNFYGMEDIIDALGGVDVELSSAEIKNLNKSIDEVNALDPNNSVERVKNSGMQHLNGRQAVAYMRIRKIGGDQERVLRQQRVLSGLFKKVKDIDVVEIPGLIGTLSEYVRTDMNAGTMLDIATTVKGMQGAEIEKFRYPDKFQNGRYKKMSVVQPEDFDTEIAKLHGFLE